MFHKENSIQGIFSNAPAANDNNKGGKKQNQPSSNNKKKAMDVPLGKKERKQLRQRVQDFFQRGKDDEFPNQLSPLLDHIFINDGNLMIRTLPYPNNTTNKAWTMNLYLKTPNPNIPKTNDNDAAVATAECWPYETSHQFVWMALQEKKQIVQETPTVALWAIITHVLDAQNNDKNAYNDWLNSYYRIQVPCQVSKYLCRGADLMRAGIRSTLSKELQNQQSQKSKIKTNDDDDEKIMVAISIFSNPQPFAVGVFQQPFSKPIGVDTKGIGVEIWNCYGDDIWRHCSTKDQISNNPSNLNVIGGAPFDNGHYGNVGFLEGKLVVPVVNVGEGEDEEEDDDKNDNETNQEPKTAWDEPGDVTNNNAKQPEQDEPGVTSTTLDDGETDNQKDETNIDGTDKGDNQNKEEQQKEEKKEEEEAPRSPEDILHQAVCQALVSLQNKDLPMPLATFYSQYVIPNRPSGTTIELKATKYKKFGNYIKEQMENGLLQAGPDKSNPKNTDPLAMLLTIRKKHEDLQGYSKADSATANNNDATAKTKLVLVNLFVIPSHWTNLLRLNRDDVDATNATSEDRKGTGMLTAPEVRKIQETYLEREELIPSNRPDLISLDGPLTEALYKKVPNPPTQLPRKDFHQQFISKCLSAYALVQMPGSKIIVLKKGQPPKVEIEVSMRQSKKFVTRIRGLEDYDIDPILFSKDVAKRLACSTTIEDDPASSGRAALKKGRVELVFQGNLVDELEALLTGDESLSSHGGVKDAGVFSSPNNGNINNNRSYYAFIPKSVLDITLRKGVPARKRRGTNAGSKKRK